MVESVNNVPENSKFSVSLLAFWIKVSMTVDNNFIHINMPNTVLFGLIPAGSSQDSSPLQGVSNVYTSKSYDLLNMFIGAIIALFGIMSLSYSFLMALILLIIGVVLFGSGIKTRFSYERSGIIKNIDVPFFEANHVEEFSQQVQRVMSGYQEDRNVRINTDRTIEQSQQNTQQIVQAVQGEQQSVAQSSDETNAVEVDETQSQEQSTTSDEIAFCSKCGNKFNPGDAFCTKCGAKKP